jgi:hypothetical protein
MHWIDPKSLPATTGKVEQFLRNSEAEANGMLLDGDREVHFPPHLAAAVLKVIKVGDEVTVRGAKPRDADLVAAISLETASGTHIEDRGPKHGEHAHVAKTAWRKAELTGTVRRRLHGPKGEINGAVLDGGAVLRVEAKGTPGLADVLVPGAAITAQGDAIDDALGLLLRVRRIRRSGEPLQAAEKPNKRHETRPHHAREPHGSE